MNRYAVTRKPRRKRVRSFDTVKASEAVEGLAGDLDIFGFTRGEFSCIELIEALLDYSGLADVTISTWTAADADMRRAKDLLHDQRIRSVRWIVDYSFETRQPGFCQTLRELFGDEAIRVMFSHSKFVLFDGDRKILLHTSMNMNQNKRIEDFWITQDPELFGHYARLVDDVFFAQPSGATFGQRRYRDTKAEFDALGRVDYVYATLAEGLKRSQDIPLR